MYRIQMSGNDYELNKEIGLHYQIHRGIGVHHQQYNNLKNHLKLVLMSVVHPRIPLQLCCPFRKVLVKQSFQDF